MSDNDIRAFCAALPKTELHAHLNTSFSEKTLQALLDKRKTQDGKLTFSSMTYKDTSSGSLDDAFNKMSQVQTVCNNADAIYTLAYDIIHEFAAENVKYLELRSTPKTIPETGLTPELYLDSMLRAIRVCEEEGVDVIVRVLPSIDRRHGVDTAYKTVSLAHKYMQTSGGVVCGIDFSGDPSVGDAADFIPVFQHAHNNGLKLGLHLAEIANFKETLEVLKGTTVGRIGHGTFIHQAPPDHKDLEEVVLQQRVPIEVCMTSNIRGQTVQDYNSHHLDFWYKKNHPIIICTDGKGTFNTTLTDEYIHAATVFGLSRHKLWDLSLSSIDHIFAEDDIKKSLREKWEKIKPSMNFKD